MEFYLPGGGEGWPGGVRQQYAAARTLLAGTIRDVKSLPALQVRKPSPAGQHLDKRS